MASKVSGVIEKINVSGTERAIASSAYGYCETAATEPAKVVDMTDFKLYEGVTVHVKFKNGNTVTNPTLNIQSTGAKPMVFSSTLKDIDGNFGWHSDEILTLTYDGTSWLTTNSAYATSAGYVLSGNIKPMYSKTYVTKLYSNPSSGDNYFQTVFSITPDTYDIIWEVKYRLTFTVSGHNDYNAIYDCSMSGRSQALYSYHCYNSLVTYPIYYHCLYRGSSLSYPHEVGFRIASSYGDTTVQKTVKVDIIETINCTTSFFEDIKSYRNETITGYARSDINSTSNGLQETGDNDTTGRDYSHSGYSINGSDFRLAAYTLFGYDQNQKVQGISLYQPGYTSSTTNLSTTRIYNTAGFAWEKGLWFTNSWTNYAQNANLDFSPAEFFYAVDLRYTDNVYLHKTTTSELGIVARKPLYFRGIIGEDGLFYLAPITVTHNNTSYQRAWTQDIPTSNNDYVYWLIGPAYYNGSYAASGYQVNLVTENKLYWYHDGRFQEYLPHAIKADSVPLSGVTNATDLQAIENLSGNTGLLKKTAANTWTLDTNSYVTSSGITSVTIGATSPVQSSTSTAQMGSSASTTISLKDAYGDTKNPYGSKTKNYVLAAPSNANGVPSFRALVAADIPALAYVPAAGGANDINTIVNTGVYNITSGSATNGPKGYGYGQLLVMSYRKHTGNTTTDWASQIYLHNGGGTASGSATAPGNVLYYRTSNNSSSNTWFDWQKAVHAAAAYSKVGDTNKPVYIAEDGTATAISYTIGKSVPADAVFTDHYAWGDITGKPTKITLTGAVTGNVSLGQGDLSLSTTVNHNHDDRYKIASGVITLGSSTITPITSVNGHSGASVSVTASDLGLASALKYVGTKSSLPTATDSTTYSTYNNGDVITVSNKEYAYVKGSNAAGSNWVELGDEGSYKLKQTAFTNSTGTADGSNTSTTFIYSFSQDANGVITNIKTRKLPTYNNYTHPDTAGNKHIPTGGSTGQFLQYGGSSGTASWHTLVASDIPDLSTTYKIEILDLTGVS